MTQKDSYVVIAFDKMKIKSSLVYHKNTGRLIGFVELGDLNNEFAHLSQLEDDSTPGDFNFNRKLATHVNLFMVRSISYSLLYPFGYFATAGMTASQLYLTTIEAVRVLTALNFKVFFNYNNHYFLGLNFC